MQNWNYSIYKANLVLRSSPRHNLSYSRIFVTIETDPETTSELGGIDWFVYSLGNVYKQFPIIKYDFEFLNLIWNESLKYDWNLITKCHDKSSFEISYNTYIYKFILFVIDSHASLFPTSKVKVPAIFLNSYLSRSSTCTCPWFTRSTCEYVLVHNKQRIRSH